MTIQENVFLAMLDGSNSIDEIIEACNYSDWQVRHAIGRLRMAGMKITNTAKRSFVIVKRSPKKYHGRHIFQASHYTS